MNETLKWYCDVCDKTIIIKSKSKRNNSKTHIHNKQSGIVVKECEFFKPEVHEANDILNNTIKDCKIKTSHAFE